MKRKWRWRRRRRTRSRSSSMSSRRRRRRKSSSIGIGSGFRISINLSMSNSISTRPVVRNATINKSRCTGKSLHSSCESSDRRNCMPQVCAQRGRGPLVELPVAIFCIRHRLLRCGLSLCSVTEAATRTSCDILGAWLNLRVVMQERCKNEGSPKSQCAS